MRIKTVSIIGLGALGVLYANHLSKHIPNANLRIIADQKRIKRYETEGIYCNGERCDFTYITPETPCEPADLILFTVKYDGLKDAVQSVKNHVGERTVILSALNGISSEEVIGEVYGMDKVLYCVAQGMDAVKVGNQLTYKNMGLLCFGDREHDVTSDHVKRVAAFFDQVDVPYEIIPDMYRKLWSKFMLNVGVNQTVAVYQSNYGEVHREGPAREMMIDAMREVMLLSEKEGIHLTEADIDYWMDVLDTLSPEGKPSMAQDVEAKRYSEVELFAGTVLKLGEKHGMSTQVNLELYEKIKSMEANY
jgi:2-dehydropantoate 2-reductase